MSRDNLSDYFTGIWGLNNRIRDLQKDLEEFKDRAEASEKIDVNGIVTRELDVERYEDQNSSKRQPVNESISDQVVLQGLIQYLIEKKIINKDSFQEFMTDFKSKRL